MKAFYFTYGTDETMPYYGGWTIVYADNEPKAREIFKVFHPSKNGLLNCANVYGEDEFKETRMYSNGNFGYRLHSVIGETTSEEMEQYKK